MLRLRLNRYIQLDMSDSPNFACFNGSVTCVNDVNKRNKAVLFQVAEKTVAKVE